MAKTETNDDLQEPEEDEDLDQDRIDGTDEGHVIDMKKLDELIGTLPGDTKSVKKSFELKSEMEDEEDDAAVFIVHEEDDNEGEEMELEKKDLSGQDQLFV